MSETETQSNQGNQPSSSLKIPILFGLAIALAVASGFLFFQIHGLRQDMSRTKDEILLEVSKLRQSSDVTTAANRQHLDTLRGDLEATRRQASLVASDVKKEAVKHADQIAKKLQQEQTKQQEQVKTEIDQVKMAASTANQKIADVTTDVGVVKTEVQSTKSELQKTIEQLKSVQGDLGVQSGLIATNSQELEALKTLGQRNYYEFNLAKTKEPQRVGDISVTLKKADPKRNRYTILVLADDKRVEKKDKTANEPVQFYVSGARQPYEIVVNEVQKDRIVGYLAAPKVMQARRS
jgi:uncharacterized protein (DUF3084 family)